MDSVDDTETNTHDQWAKLGAHSSLVVTFAHMEGADLLRLDRPDNFPADTTKLVDYLSTQPDQLSPEDMELVDTEALCASAWISLRVWSIKGKKLQFVESPVNHKERYSNAVYILATNLIAAHTTEYPRHSDLRPSRLLMYDR